MVIKKYYINYNNNHSIILFMTLFLFDSICEPNNSNTSSLIRFSSLKHHNNNIQ